MSLTVFINLPLTLATLLTVLILTLPVSLVNGYTTLLDSTLRTTLNGSFLESYSFWWTSLTYLPFFFITLLLLTLTNKGGVSGVNRLPVYPLLIFLVYLTEVVDYTPLNILDLTTSYADYGLNRLLTNSLNKYHPFIFYFSTCLLLSTAWLCFIGSTPRSTPFNIPKLLAYWDRGSWLVVLVNLSSLLMGSWWALQEGTWGGWWNWDSSEVLGLEVSFAALALNHSYFRVRCYEKLSLKAIPLVSVFIMSYFFIQLNFELVSHNFGSKFFFFFNNNLFSIEVILTLMLLIATIFRFYSQSSQTETSFLGLGSRGRAISHPTLIRLYIPGIVLVWMFWGYKPLLNYFSWNFFGLNLFNYDSSIQVTNAFLLMGALFWGVTYSSRSFILHVALIMSFPNWFWALLLTVAFFTIPLRIHSLIAWFMVLNLVLADLYPVLWFTQTPYLNTFSPLTASWISEMSLAADVYSWDCIKGMSNLTSRTSSNWDIISLMNTTSTNFFSLDLTHQLCLNYYELGSSYVTAYLEFQLPAIPTLVCIYLSGFISLSSLLWYPHVSTP